MDPYIEQPSWATPPMAPMWRLCNLEKSLPVSCERRPFPQVKCTPFQGHLCVLDICKNVLGRTSVLDLKKKDSRSTRGSPSVLHLS